MTWLDQECALVIFIIFNPQSLIILTIFTILLMVDQEVILIPVAEPKQTLGTIVNRPSMTWLDQVSAITFKIFTTVDHG